MNRGLDKFWPRRVRLVFACAALFSASCASAKGQLAVLRYEQFGPQAAVYEWLGYEWWQWQREGDPDPNKRYDIRVVVFKNCSLNEVKRRYPVDPAKLHDYRYISFDQALRQLKKLIAENALPDLTAQLEVTRTELQRRFE